MSRLNWLPPAACTAIAGYVGDLTCTTATDSRGKDISGCGAGFLLNKTVVPAVCQGTLGCEQACCLVVFPACCLSFGVSLACLKQRFPAL